MRNLAIRCIIFYQRYLSLILKLLLGQPRICYQDPTCSEFTKQMIERYGIVSGSLRGVRRILSCRPKIVYV